MVIFRGGGPIGQEEKVFKRAQDKWINRLRISCVWVHSCGQADLDSRVKRGISELKQNFLSNDWIL